VVDGFEKNISGYRGFRVGIDASIWFFHAAYGREGENPELRTLFFRCARLLSLPFLPLFVFDGPKRPSIKRNKRITGNAHWLTNGMKNIIEAFGFEWKTARIPFLHHIHCILNNLLILRHLEKQKQSWPS
jgi:holliday junction resolvase YEN1